MKTKPSHPRANEDQTAGSYANYFEVGHNAHEFVLDFGQLYLEKDGVVCRTRIVTGPAYARALLATLQGAVEQYERTYGAIPADDASYEEKLRKN